MSGNGTSQISDTLLLKKIRGPLWGKMDFRFFTVMVISLVCHSLFLMKISTMKIKPEEIVVIEKIPERFAKLIVDKPIKNEIVKKETFKKTISKPEVSIPEKKIPKTEEKSIKIQQNAAKKAVAARAAKIEKNIRTVGVLGMLTGVGKTAKGPSVIDVLGTMKTNTNKIQDLEKALENMNGLQQSKDISVIQRKLVRSKEVMGNHRADITNLVATIGNANTTTLSKKGNFIIQRPESIEGAASSNMKRDTKAINKIVASHKTSIRMSYDKYLQRIPDLEGKITIRFSISAPGRVTLVEILENTTGNKDLEQDIIRKIKMWRFEPIPEGTVSVTYPFLFRPS